MTTEPSLPPAVRSRLSHQPLREQEGALVYTHGLPTDAERRFGRGFASRLVDLVYADHDRSRVVRRKLGELHSAMLRDGGLGLNFGSGRSPRRAGIVNMDVYLSESVDLVYDGSTIPFRDSTFDLVMSQEVLEHISDPQAALAEIARVAKPGALLFLQLPFIIGYHSVPGDFWRFSTVGIERFVESTGHFEVLEKSLAVGHGTGLHRILVEFIATTCSAVSGRLYRPVKLASAILFYWLKLFDALTPYCTEKDRIAGGYFVVARRTG